MSSTHPRSDGGAADPGRREPLSRRRVLTAGARLADQVGLRALSMRRLGQELGVEAMSLYNHVANKRDLLDGMLDLVVGEIHVAEPDMPWRTEVRRQAISAHEVLVRHGWAAELWATSEVGPARVRYMDGLLGALRGAGFSALLAHHAYHAIDNHVVGSALQSAASPYTREELGRIGAAFLERLAIDRAPHLVEHVRLHVDGAPDDGVDGFAFGVDLLLDGLGRRGPTSG